MLFMDNKNTTYEVINADDDLGIQQEEFDTLHDENGILSLDGTWDIDELKEAIEDLTIMKQFKLYELLNKNVRFAFYPMNTVTDCLNDFDDSDNLSNEDKLDFIREFFVNYLEESINDLTYSDIERVLKFLQANSETFNYTFIQGYCQGDECYLFNNQGLVYDQDAIAYDTDVIYGGLVEINVLDGEFTYTEAVLTDDYNPEYEPDKIIAYMKKHYNASPVDDKVLN